MNEIPEAIVLKTNARIIELTTKGDTVIEE